MKKSFFIILILISLCFVPLVEAKDNINLRNSTESGMREMVLTVRDENFRNRARREIERRIEALNKLITDINKVKRLTTEQKNELNKQVQTEINNLKTLETKIAGDTDSAILKLDVESIIKSYRIYALFIPKIHLLAAAGILDEAADNITVIANKLQTRINEAKTQGIETASMETALKDMLTKIADAKTQATNIRNTVLSLKPEDYPNNKTELQTARNFLKNGHNDIKAAHTDAKTIIKALRTTPTPTPKLAN